MFVERVQGIVLVVEEKDEGKQGSVGSPAFLVADWIKQSRTLNRGDTKTYGLKGRKVTATDS